MINKLTDEIIKNLQPKQKPYKKFDKQIKIHEKAIKVLKLSIHNINLLND